ncbi:hypothetical protein M8818_004338 [Zalaria obscura]|uniref:Uncharacterized protein n=1 Tax=Zalaria obscura TaxID=2024903 RepID=A0ACC3SAV5_9PEZI
MDPLTLEIQAQLIQAYMLLHSQQTSVRRRMSSSSESSSPTSPTMTPATSPRHRRSSSATPPTGTPPFSPVSPRASHRSNSISLSLPSSIPEEDSDSDAAERMNADEDKLRDINTAIKTTLTDLLNLEPVRHDMRMRQWVQTRLMDAEQELKHQKRRRISVEEETPVVNSIADGMASDMPRKVSI